MAYLGIDMGGTASRWVMLDPDGAVIARGQAPGASALPGDPAREAGFVAALAALAGALPCPADRAHLGLTGAGFTPDPALSARISRALGLPAAAVSHENDLTLAHRAVFGGGEGHLVLAGTGSVGMGLRGGVRVVVGGRGVLIDDRGSAQWIALRALAALYRRIDEAGAPEGLDHLAHALFTQIGGDDWDLVRALVHGPDRGRIGLLARAVAVAAEAGCAFSRELLDEAAGELAAMAGMLERRLGPAPLAFAGGVIGLHPAIRAGILARLAPRAPDFPRPDAAHTAAMIARERA